MGDEPQVIMQNIEETRSALTEKLETLEQQVVDTVQEATSAVADTVDNVKTAVQETVETVKDTVQNTVTSMKESVQDTVHSVGQTFNLVRQTRRHPWSMFGSAILLGVITERFFPGPSRSVVAPVTRPTPFDSTNGRSVSAEPFEYLTDEEVEDEPTPVPAAKAPVATAATVVAAPAVPGFIDTLLKQFEPEIEKVKGMAIGSLMGVVRQMAKDAAPEQLKHQVSEVIDSMTQKLGGEPVRAV